MTTMNKTNVVAKRLVSLATITAVVAIFAGLSLPQAQAGFIENFESGYADGALLSDHALWHADAGGNHAQRFHGAANNRHTTVNGKGHDGSGGDGGFGVYNGSGTISGGPAREHGESTASGNFLIAEFDYKPTSEETHVGFINLAGSYVGLALVQSGPRFASGTGAEPSIVVTSGSENIFPGDWHRVTFSHQIDGPNTNTTVDIFNYNKNTTFSFHPSVAIAPNTGNLHKFVIHTTDPGGTQFDNISVTSPEPTSAILWALGMISMLGYCRRNR